MNYEWGQALTSCCPKHEKSPILKQIALCVGENMDDWCDQQESVPDGDRIYRCTKCGKRLHPRKTFGSDGALAGWRLPPHKKKGHKIRALKDRQSKIRT